MLTNLIRSQWIMDVLKVGTVAIPAWVQINSEPSAVMMESGTQMFEL